MLLVGDNSNKGERAKLHKYDDIEKVKLKSILLLFYSDAVVGVVTNN